MNKKGQIIEVNNIYSYFIWVIIILAAGLGIAVLGSVFHIVGDGVIPALNSSTQPLPGEINKPIELAADINAMIPWLTGAVYTIALFMTLILSYAYRTNGEKVLMVLYFTLMVMTILVCILLSNIYENFYNAGGSLGAELQSHELLSFLILYSPVLMSVLLVVGAAIMFSGFEEGNL